MLAPGTNGPEVVALSHCDTALIGIGGELCRAADVTDDRGARAGARAYIRKPDHKVARGQHYRRPVRECPRLGVFTVDDGLDQDRESAAVGVEGPGWVGRRLANLGRGGGNKRR